MFKKVVLILAILLALIGLLGAYDVIPIMTEDAEDEGRGDDAHLLAEEEEGDGVTLEGLGTGRKKTGTEAEASSTLTVEQPATVAGSTPGGGVVRGRVVLAKSGLPVRGVRVTLSRPDSIISYLRAEANGRFDSLEAWSGEDGRFTFKDVRPSQGYALRAFHDAHAAVSRKGRIDLRGRGTIDVGDLELGPGATVTGRVVDEAGAPVAGVRIAVTWAIRNPLSVVIVHPDTAPELEKEAVSDDQGRFTIEKLEPGPKTIFAEVEGGGADVKSRVNLKDGITRELKDFVIPNNRVLAGRVQWKSGGPVPGARVFGAPGQDTAMRATEADEEGRFRLTHLPEGQAYTLGVLVEGLPVEYAQGFELDDENIVIEFDDPGALTGTVTDAATGKPVERFAIQLDSAEPPEDFQRRFVEQQVKQGLGPAPMQSKDGRFTLPQVAPGTYIVNVHAAGFPSVRKTDVTIVVGETTDVRIELPVGNRAQGRVERANGDPVGRARLYVMPAGSVEKRDRPILSVRGFTEDREPAGATLTDGSFELPPQTPGRYDLLVEVEGELPGVLHDVDLSDGDVGDLLVRLPPSGTVAGRILGEGGRPAVGEEVYVLFPSGAVRTVRSDEDGRFEQGGLPVGRCLIRWVSLNDTKHFTRFIRDRADGEREQGYDKLRQKGEEHVISDGQTTRVVLQLPQRTKVSGRFRIGGNEPPEGKRTFYITVEGGGRWVDVECDARGEFEFRMPPGTYITYAPTAADEWTIGEIVVPDASSHTWDLDTE